MLAVGWERARCRELKRSPKDLAMRDHAAAGVTVPRIRVYKVVREKISPRDAPPPSKRNTREPC